MSATKLVGDRFALRERQRKAVLRSGCSEERRRLRRGRRRSLSATRGALLLIDGFNLLTTIEAALAGGILLLGRDGCLRDMASMHGSYRKVSETEPALRQIGEVLALGGPASCRWYLDRPVSNSGRLASLIRNVAAREGWPWQVELVDDPDPVLCKASELVVSADSMILDHAEAHVNLAREVAEARVSQRRVVDLSRATASSEERGG